MGYFVNQITADKWIGVSTEDEVVVSPDLEDLHRTIEALDAEIKTSVFLKAETGAYMAIGGGHDQYVVYISPADQEFWNLIADEADANGTISLVIGGQDGDYPARQVVDKNIAMKAAESFFLKGEREPSLHWELQK